MRKKVWGDGGSQGGQRKQNGDPSTEINRCRKRTSRQGKNTK